MLQFLSLFFKTTPKESSAKALFKKYQDLGWGETDFLSYFIQYRIPFDEPLNDQNETTLHLLVQLSTLENFVDYLQSFPPKNLNPKNVNGQTPLDLAITLGKQCLAQHLLFLGAKCAKSDLAQSLLCLSLSSQSDDLWQAQDMSAKAEVIRLFKSIHTPTHDAFVLIITMCRVLHLELSGPFDENNNSLLHLFIKYGYPAMVIDLFLIHCTRKDIKAKNLDKNTPLMLATKKSEQSIQQILQRHEAPNQPDNDTLEVSSSVAFKLMDQIEADLSKHVGVMTPKKKAEIIFNSFVHFLKSAKWSYDPEVNYPHSMLLLPANESYTADCMSIANALLILFHANGLFDIVPHFIEPEPNEDIMQMHVPPLKKPGIIGTYNCFDKDKQKKMIKDGFVIFGMHQILRRTDEPFFYDPVFSCCYAGEQAIPVIRNSALLQNPSAFLPYLKAQNASDARPADRVPAASHIVSRIPSNQLRNSI